MWQARPQDRQQTRTLWDILAVLARGTGFDKLLAGVDLAREDALRRMRSLG